MLSIIGARLGGPVETELQVRLLERTKRHVELTPAGRVFQAREVVARADHAALIARRTGQHESPPLRVAIGVCMDQAFVATVISRFTDRHPRVRVEAQTVPVSDQIDALRGERIDVGFVRSTDARLPPAVVRRAALSSKETRARVRGHHDGNPADIRRLRSRLRSAARIGCVGSWLILDSGIDAETSPA
jgi:DNA-binding transcriptional LysR family regulator